MNISGRMINVETENLFHYDGFCGAFAYASAAINACVFVDFSFSTIHGDCFYGTC